MKRLFVIVAGLLASLAFMYAGTPVQEVIYAFNDERGVQVIDAKGGIMVFARAAIRKTPLAPMADLVKEVTVCKMNKSSSTLKDEFLPKLRSTLKAHYIYYGVKPGEEGRPVEVYGSAVEENAVSELVVFNPRDFSLFSLRGSFPVEELMNLDN